MVTNPFPGKLINFEGIDASGKTGAVTRLKNVISAFHLSSADKVLFTKEPATEHESGREIYEILKGRHPTLSVVNMHPFEMQSHYFRNRIWHYKNKVLPAL